MAAILTKKDYLESLSHKLLKHNESCNELSIILSEEQELIIQNNSEGLLTILERKQTLITKIESDQIKINFIIEENLLLELSTKSVLRFFKNFSKKDPVLANKAQSLWAIFIERSQIVKQKNLVNGHLLNKQNAKNQLLISLLRGQKPAASLYGENGKSARPSYSAHLGQA
ncbi:MAG: flagellar protein FlgN [Saccharospirillaceae bacterium]|nr:flagellar protein FlgN [Pseudomonadales bacterium]NRB80219.1 flagellar protein FlgN [Saccharospirillaceae bacterium]